MQRRLRHVEIYSSSGSFFAGDRALCVRRKRRSRNNFPAHTQEGTHSVCTAAMQCITEVRMRGRVYTSARGLPSQVCSDESNFFISSELTARPNRSRRRFKLMSSADITAWNDENGVDMLRDLSCVLGGRRDCVTSGLQQKPCYELALVAKRMCGRATQLPLHAVPIYLSAMDSPQRPRRAHAVCATEAARNDASNVRANSEGSMQFFLVPRSMT